MKLNLKTLILIALTLVIWGIIGFQIYKSVYLPSDTGSTHALEDMHMEPLMKEERKLELTYRDPFLSTERKLIDATPILHVTNSTRQNTPKIEISWSRIVLKGSMVTANKKTAIITFDAKEYILAENAVLEDFVIKLITNDSILVVNNAHQKWIKKIKSD